MDIRGITKFSLVDFPGKLSCIIFVGKCNFRCPYCHNPYLVLFHESQPRITEDEVLEFMISRKGKLDGIVISGGEPSLYSGLVQFAKRVKELGFGVKIDTNGSNPERIIAMCDEGLVDMLGIDYKSPADSYNEITNCKMKSLADRVQSLIRYAVDKDVPCDIRTTVHKKFHPPEILHKMRKELDSLGVKKWHLQQFHSTEIIDESLLDEETYDDREFRKLTKELGVNTYSRGIMVMH